MRPKYCGSARCSCSSCPFLLLILGSYHISGDGTVELKLMHYASICNEISNLLVSEYSREVGALSLPRSHLKYVYVLRASSQFSNGTH